MMKLPSFIISIGKHYVYFSLQLYKLIVTVSVNKEKSVLNVTVYNLGLCKAWSFSRN